MRLSVLKHKKLAAFLFTVLLLGLWYASKTPSNDREWSLDQQVLPYAEIAGDEITVYNIRNFSYQSTSEYTPAYYDKTFSLSELTSVDYIVEPFGSIGAAHTFVSFGFSTGDYLAISVEIRKEVDESFSPIKGLLRNYELMYVVADERDVVKLRTNYRQNDVYLYPIDTSLENKQQLFVDMLTRVNELKEKPEFYNTLTNTCTTNIADHVNEITPSRIPWDLRLLFPENSDELAYELGLLDNSIPLEELRKQHLINEEAEKYADSAYFSKLIRQ
jgi:hypothetical protein